MPAQRVGVIQPPNAAVAAVQITAGSIEGDRVMVVVGRMRTGLDVRPGLTTIERPGDGHLSAGVTRIPRNRLVRGKMVTRRPMV